MIPKYSLCITTKNDGGTIQASLDSITRQLDSRFEIILVDAGKKTKYDFGNVHHFVSFEKCNRGKGKQKAFQYSSGDYIIDQLDTDDIYKKCFQEIIEFYHANFEGFLMLMDGFLIAPRELIEEIGGWEPIQSKEDVTLWFKASQKKKFVYVPFETREISHKSNLTLKSKIKIRFVNARDSLFVNWDPFAGIPLTTGFLLYYFVSSLGVLSFFLHGGIFKKRLNASRFSLYNFIPEHLTKPLEILEK